MSQIFLKRMNSPLGVIRCVAQNDALIGVYLEEQLGAGAAGATIVSSHEIIDRAIFELEEYFAGERREFSIPVVLSGTRFQETVWAALLDIPFGDTRTYSEVANAIGNPRAVRAVGAANGRNALSILLPCHRVIGSDGSLTGYAGGVSNKDWLLKHEQRGLRAAL